MNARSELVFPANGSDGGVSETTRRFQAASPASAIPAWRPTRGSGLGAVVDELPFGVGVSVEVEWEQPATVASAAANSKVLVITGYVSRG